jgi:uncharacterized protein YgiM (DUF1202 family)
VRRLAALLLALAAADGRAATAYVSDQLVLGVYAEQNQQSQRLATLHSGSSVESLRLSGDYSQVRLSDGTTGWVKTSYLTTQLPATLRVKQLEEELDRSRATTPALAEAAARSEVEQLRHELAAKQSELDTVRAMQPGSAAAQGTGGANAAATALATHPGLWGLTVALAVALGFWLGYATLARRVKHKFGGIKVY